MNTHKTILTMTVGFALAAGLSACGGGGGGGGEDTAVGVFKDGNVTGASYVSGDQSGVTGEDGSFTYAVGKTVTFSVGGVELGTATGKSIVTPVDLVTGGATSSVAVQNIARFLMMLDKDGNPGNGIEISEAVRTVAQDWSQVDFTATDMAGEVATIITEANTADDTTHVMPDAMAARTHMEATLRCAYAGAFRGTYAGDASGTFALLVDAGTGLIGGLAYDSEDQNLIPLTGTHAMSMDQHAGFVTGTAGEGSFSGSFTSPDAMSGTWEEPSLSSSGTFTGSRIGGARDAVYRFTGTYAGDAYGVYTFDVGSDNQVTGVAYDVANDEMVELTGTLTGTALTATTTAGTAVTGTMNTATGALSGTWSDGGDSGTFSGSGCELN